MPKQKTHRGTAKRVKISGTGKLIRRRENGNHFLQKKSESRKRVISSAALVPSTITKSVKRALGV